MLPLQIGFYFSHETPQDSLVPGKETIMLTRGVPTAHGAPTHDPWPKKWPPENPGAPQGPSVPGMPSHQTWNEHPGFPLAWSGLGGVDLSTVPFSRSLSAHRTLLYLQRGGFSVAFCVGWPVPSFSSDHITGPPHPIWLSPAMWFLPASPRSCWACAHMLLGIHVQTHHRANCSSSLGYH